MSRLKPEKLHVSYLDVGSDSPWPRRYTLTHSDMTGELFLTVAREFDKKQVSGLYTRLMRDEVLGEWKVDQGVRALHIYCHASGGLVLGTPGWRLSIFRREMPLVLEAIRYGDRRLFEESPELDESPIYVHFRMGKKEVTDDWGVPADYALEPEPDTALAPR